MRVVRAGVVSAVLWLLVVAAGSSFAWVAINQAGENLVAVDAHAFDDSPDPASGPLPILPTSMPGSSAARPNTSTSRPRVSGAATAAPSSRPSAASASQSVPQTPTSTAAAPPASPAKPATPAKPAAPAKPSSSGKPAAAPTGAKPSPTSTDEARGGSTAPSGRTPAVTTGGAAGVVTVACRSGVVRVRSVTPRSGWTARVYRREAVAAVSFHREGHSTGFVLFVGCSNGSPRIVSTPRGVTIEPRAVREVLDDHTFVQIANRLDWRPAFSNGES